MNCLENIFLYGFRSSRLFRNKFFIWDYLGKTSIDKPIKECYRTYNKDSNVIDIIILGWASKIIIWAYLRENLSSGVCEQHRGRPA